MTGNVERSRQSERLKLVVSICAVAFAVTLAAFIGNRLSDESLAVLAGAVCGVSAAIPTSLLIIVVTRRQDSRAMSMPNNQSYPPVVVVAPSGAQQQPYALPSPQAHTIPFPAREFTVVGEGYE